MTRYLIILTLFFTFMTVSEFAIASPRNFLLTHSPPSTEVDEAKHASGVALIIGNNAYKNQPLTAAVNDAHLMGQMLQSKGFHVVLLENANHSEMRQAIKGFKELRKSSTSAVFYFSGHGLQLKNSTLILPTDSNFNLLRSVNEKGFDVHQLIHEIVNPRASSINLFIIDSCLSNPFNFVPVSAQGAHKQLLLPAQTVLALATSPGSMAYEGKYGNGIFSAALINNLLIPNLELADLLTRVRVTVSQQTNNFQIPVILSSVYGNYRFPRTASKNTIKKIENSTLMMPDKTRFELVARGLQPQKSEVLNELKFWDSIKNSRNVSDYRAYLAAYPKGRFSLLAKSRVSQYKPMMQKSIVNFNTMTKQQKKGYQNIPEYNFKVIKDCQVCPELVVIPPGTFTMGNNDGDRSEKPSHKVEIKLAFAIGKYEVTIREWNQCVQALACRILDNTVGHSKNAPVRDISWYDAQKYVRWLSSITHQTYRLPTEAEWEYAARGGTQSRFWWGDDIGIARANCKNCGGEWNRNHPADVHSYPRNPFGLYGMNGGVWEWVSDCWHKSYRGAPNNGSDWKKSDCRENVIRGGSWRNDASYTHSASRFKYDSNAPYIQNGFRVSKNIKE